MSRSGIGFVVLAILAVVVSVGLTMAGRAGRPLPRTAMFADVETGRVFRRNREAFAALPANNEQTGRITIYPVRQTESGRYQIPERYREPLSVLAERIELRVDFETYLIEP